MVEHVRRQVGCWQVRSNGVKNLMDAAASSNAQPAQAVTLQHCQLPESDAAQQPQHEGRDAAANYQQQQAAREADAADQQQQQQQQLLRQSSAASAQQQQQLLRQSSAASAQQQAVRQASWARQQAGLTLGSTNPQQRASDSMPQHDHGSIASSRSSEAENRDSGKQMSKKQTAPVLRRMQSKLASGSVRSAALALQQASLHRQACSDFT